MDEFIGEIRAFPYTFEPENWLPCDGRQMAISQYQVLYAVIGTNFGGNGTSVFMLPDLRGRVAIGSGQGPGLSWHNFGQRLGDEGVSITSTTQLPVHTHEITTQFAGYNKAAAAFSATPTATSYPGRIAKTAGGTILAYNPPVPTSGTTYPTNPQPMSPMSLTPVAGAMASHENRQPFLVFRYCICVQNAYFPVRS